MYKDKERQMFDECVVNLDTLLKEIENARDLPALNRAERNAAQVLMNLQLASMNLGYHVQRVSARQRRAINSGLVSFGQPAPVPEPTLEPEKTKTTKKKTVKKKASKKGE